VRRIGLLLLLLAACGLAAGCGSSSKRTSSAAASGDAWGGPTGAGQTLSIYGFGAGDEVANTRAAIARKAVAPAKVSNPSGGFSDQRFLALVAAGNAPDVVYIDRQKVGEYAARGALLPLDACISNAKIDVAQYRKPALQEVTYDGHVYGIPEFYDNRTLIVNDDAAKLARVPVAQISTQSWPKLKALTRKLAVLKNGKPTRIGFDPKLPEFFPLWAKANGADIISADGRHAQLDGPKVVQALQYAVSLIDEQGGWARFKSFRDTWDFFGKGNEFAKNQLVAFPMEDWYYNVLASTAPQVTITGKPFLARSGQPIDWATGSAWAIPKGAKHPQLACEWAKAMTATSSWLAAARARLAVAQKSKQPFTGLYTANQVADREIFAKLYKPVSPDYDKAVETVLDVQDHSFALPASPAGGAFQNAWMSAVNRVLAGQQTPRQALQQAQREAQSALDAAG
jgi:multiple sugar transport system substrate-binding protein